MACMVTLSTSAVHASGENSLMLGVAPTELQFAPNRTCFAPKCTQCKMKAVDCIIFLESFHRNFLIYFWVNEAEKTVQIIAVIYARRDQTSVLSQLDLQ